MSLTSVGSFKYDYFLRNAYRQNLIARRSDYRSGLGTNTLLQADSGAMSNISQKLRGLSYDSDHTTEVYQNTKVFIETYNNLLDATDQSKDSRISSLRSELKKLTTDSKETLSSIGIQIKANGSLSMDSETFLGCSSAKIAKVFSGNSNSNLTNSFCSLASRLKRASNRLPTYTSKGDKSTDTTEDSGNLVNLFL